MRKVFILLLALFGTLPSGLRCTGAEAGSDSSSVSPRVFILPIREDVMPPLVYLVRRGVKAAIEADADLLLLDMETNGGRVDVTEEIIEILGQFPGKTATYVNRKAFSAGAFIAFSTAQIFMAPQSVIGAAAPILMGPTGPGAEISDTMEAKMTSGIQALVRTSAEKNGYNVDVVEAMIDKSKELRIGDQVLCEKGQILTLTNVQAEQEYGDSAAPLLSSGTVDNIDSLIARLGFEGAERIEIKPTGAERLAMWINAISSILLLIGIVGIYVEFKTPGFGLPGIVGLTAFAIYFFGGYIAGLSGAEWAAVFVLGVILCIAELFIFPGTVLLGLAGITLMLASIIMAMVDVYPGLPSMPTSGISVRIPVQQILVNLSVAVFGSLLAIWALSRVLPKTALYGLLVSSSVSGEASVSLANSDRSLRQGETGVALSVLRPSGKGKFGNTVLDVISQGDLIPKDSPIRIIGFSGPTAIVETV
ncbi:MAG: hypothetical protein K9N62_07205 [Verrucomicrobia bacterium]|nr:hypothetical protein [Verrucomicrobiota bacterium]